MDFYPTDFTWWEQSQFYREPYAPGTAPFFQDVLRTPQIPEDPPTPPQHPQAFCPDWQIYDPAFNTATSVDHFSDTDTSVYPDASEGRQTPGGNQQPSRKGSKDPEKRRKLTSDRSQYVRELREALGLSQQDPCLTVLNTAIEKLGGAVPQSDNGKSAKRIRLAYKELHRLTGAQGRLKHVRCLKQVIKKVKGESPLEFVYEGQPSGSAD